MIYYVGYIISVFETAVSKNPTDRVHRTKIYRYVIAIGPVLIASYHSHDQSGFRHSSFVCQPHQYIETHREVPMFVNNTMSTTHTDWLEETQLLDRPIAIAIASCQSYSY